MPRGLTTAQQKAIASPNVCLGVLAELHFKTYSLYTWSGSGSIAYNGNIYTGVGLMGKVSVIQESNQVLATGMSLTLNGFDTTDLELPELQGNIAISNKASVYVVLFDPVSYSVISGTAITAFSGYMGKCEVDVGAAKSTVTIQIESKLAQLNRPKVWRYSLTDIHYWNPAEGAFNWTVFLQDYTFRFGN